MLTMVDSVLTTRGKKKLGGERNALIVEICALLVEDNRASALALSCALADFGIVFHLANSLSGARRCLLDLYHHIDAVLLVPALSDGRAEDLLPEIDNRDQRVGAAITHQAGKKVSNRCQARAKDFHSR
jgi:DNA-binding NtrC family response regulator